MALKRVLCSVLSLLLLLCALPVLTACSGDEVQGLRIAVLDVGQSDAILISQGEHHLLIDAGTVTARGDLLGALSALGVKTLDCLLLTHPHEDHVGNARAVIEKYTPEQLLVGGTSSDEITYTTALDAAEKQNCPVDVLEKGDVFYLGDAKCEVLHAGGATGENNDSVVLRVVYDERVFLFMGDAEAELEDALLDEYPAERLDCDFLKVGHHGSDTGTTARFLEVVTPSVAAISCGEDNSYGFPHRAVLEALDGVGAVCYRTDLSGMLIFECDGEEIVYGSGEAFLKRKGEQE